MFHILTHISGKKCLFNSEDQTYTIIPDTSWKFFKNGKIFNFAESIGQFIESDNSTCIIPMFCLESKIKGKRVIFRFLDRHSEVSFFNVERIGDKWKHNECDQCKPNRAYFLFVQRNNDALNGCMVKSVMEIEKNKR